MNLSAFSLLNTVFQPVSVGHLAAEAQEGGSGGHFLCFDVADVSRSHVVDFTSGGRAHRKHLEMSG